MDDLISRQAAIDLAKDLIIPSESFHQYNQGVSNYCAELVKLQPAEPPYNPDDRLAKIADILEGTIDHFDLEDAMDVLYQIKDVLR